MDTTDCLDLTYPECDPPYTKDASDIAQFQTLALEVDAAVQAFADRVEDIILKPDLVLMGGGITTAGRDIMHEYTVVVWDNASMADTTSGGIRIQEDGYYMIGGWVRANGAVAAGIGTRIEPLLNGDVFTSRQGPGRPVLAGASATDDLAWSDTAFLRAGDLLTAMTHHADSAVLSVTYSTQIWAFQVVANV